MNFKELVNNLNGLKIAPKYYAVLGDLKDNAYTIERLCDGRYQVYYSERGEKCEIKNFENESAACEELLNRIKFNLLNGIDLTFKSTSSENFRFGEKFKISLL